MTTWVLLRGLGREHGHWGGFPALFGAALGAGVVLTPDLPGCGRLRGESSPWRLTDMVAACRRQVLAAGPPPPYGVLGLSLGAMVAIRWAIERPDELAGGVLINTSARPFCRSRQRLRPACLPGLLQLLAGRRDPQALERTVLALTSRRAGTQDAVVEDWSQIRRLRPVRRADVLRQLWAAARFVAPADPPRVPLLVLASNGDALVDPGCSRQLAARWQLPFCEHEWAGHDLPLDDGPWVARQVAAWCPPLLAGPAPAPAGDRAPPPAGPLQGERDDPR